MENIIDLKEENQSGTFKFDFDLLETINAVFDEEGRLTETTYSQFHVLKLNNSVRKKGQKERKGRWRKLVALFTMFCFVEVYFQSIETVTNKNIQKTQLQISKYKSDLDSLEMEKTELVSFNRLAEVCKKNGYIYKNNYFQTSVNTQDNQNSSSEEGN